MKSRWLGPVMGVFAMASVVMVAEFQATGESAGTAAKKTVRKVEDKACEMVNGKLECIGKKAKHKIQNTKDEAQDKVNEMKEKTEEN
jgi:hypothetical protein